jgi:hypothetical protein
LVILKGISGGDGLELDLLNALCLYRDIKKGKIMSLKSYYDREIKPISKVLDTILRVKHIPIKQVKGDYDITVTIKEDGIVVDCNHAGADYKTVTVYPDGSDVVLACDKCNKQLIGGEWV